MNGEIETTKDDTDEAKITTRWLRELSLASTHESKWRKRAQKVIERYRDEEAVTDELTDPPTEGEKVSGPGPAVAEDAVAEAQRAGIEAERLRAVGILNLCAEHDVTRFAGDFIARGLSLPEVEERLDMLRRYTAGNGPELRPGITRSNSTGSWQAVIDKIIQGTNK